MRSWQLYAPSWKTKIEKNNMNADEDEDVDVGSNSEHAFCSSKCNSLKKKNERKYILEKDMQESMPVNGFSTKQNLHSICAINYDAISMGPPEPCKPAFTLFAKEIRDKAKRTLP